jgi:chorismate lyase/3-hydroxybenzoate synthase
LSSSSLTRLDPPSWTDSWLGGDVRRTSTNRAGLSLTARSGSVATFVTVDVPNVRALADEPFRRAVVDAYAAIRRAVDASGYRHVVRMWNHIPGIHDAMGGADDCDRYMVFNAGRFAALSEWFGGASNVSAKASAASGVGHDGDALVVHALAAASPGEPVENPDQVPSYKYSRKYGPVPPCFARATRVRRLSLDDALLISGTAAITGEQSRHPGDLASQFELTLRHLRTLVRGAIPDVVEGRELSRLSHVRVYVPPRVELADVQSRCQTAFAGEIEYLRADLCRADLLVEIEGVAVVA